MDQNFSKRFEMQIPRENTCAGSNIMEKQDSHLKFLENTYEFPSNNLNEITDFILSVQEYHDFF